MLYLVDTGVWLRLFDRGDSNHAAIRQSLQLLRDRGHRPVFNAQIAAEFWNVSTRPLTARGGYGLSTSMVELRLRFMERWGFLLPESPAAFAEWKRLVVAHGISGAAVHDARLVAAMTTAGIQRLITLNSADFRRYGQVVVLSPDEVVATG